MYGRGSWRKIRPGNCQFWRNPAPIGVEYYRGAMSKGGSIKIELLGGFMK